ncbi:MAG: toxin-antitoxin system YwqK family antitoxin [Flavobacteriia bacterium]
MKSFILFIVFTVLCKFSFAQNIQIIPKEPKQNGKSEIYHKLKIPSQPTSYYKRFKYYPRTQIIDWEKSLEQINKPEQYKGNLHGCGIASNYGRNVSTGKYEDGFMYYIEKCKFVDGQKNGPFIINELYVSCTYESLGSKYTYYLTEGECIMKGNYVNGKIDGTTVVQTFITFNEQPKSGVIQINFANGEFADQKITYPERVDASNFGWSYFPEILFKDGKVKEIRGQDFEDQTTYYYKYSDSTCEVLKYTKRPLCFNKFTFSQNALMNLEVNGSSLESYKLYWDKLSSQFLLQGNYRLFSKGGKSFMDTSVLLANYNFKDGKRIGSTHIWHYTKNGKNGDTPQLILNYENDLLNGKCEQYYEDGKLAISTSFLNGFPVGETSTYYNPGNKVFKLKSQIVPENGKPVVLTIDQLGERSNDNIESIKLIREKGGVISDMTAYGLFTSIVYKLDSIQTNGTWIKVSTAEKDFSYYNNGKPMVMFIINKDKPVDFKDIKYFDQTGKEVYSLIKAKEELTKKSIELKQQNEKRDNELRNCKWCNKSVRFGDMLMLGSCSCFDNNHKPVNLSLTWPDYFCSRECRMKYEKECCRKNGYSFE